MEGIMPLQIAQHYALKVAIDGRRTRCLDMK